MKRCGIVISAHCTCLAGLGETCSHVAAMLFKTWLMRERLEERESSTTACTSVKCLWILPNSMPNMSAKRLADIVFSNKGSQSCSNVVSIPSPMQTDNVATVCYCKQQFSNGIGMLKCTADVCQWQVFSRKLSRV